MGKNNDLEIKEAGLLEQGIIPKQYIGKWTNESGKRLRIVQYFSLEDLTIKKIFIPFDVFMKLKMKEYYPTVKDTKYCNIYFDYDEQEDRDIVIDIKVAGQFEINLL